MEKENDPLMKDIKQTIQEMRPSSTTDITDRVMGAIANKALLPPYKAAKRRRALYISSSVAACLALALGVTHALLPSHVGSDDGAGATTSNTLFDEMQAQSAAPTVDEMPTTITDSIL